MTNHELERAIYSALRMASTRSDWPRPKTGVRNIECARDMVRARAVAEHIAPIVERVMQDIRQQAGGPR